MRAATIFFTALGSLFATICNADCLKYEPSPVTVSGTIFVQQDYGPPGYGEDPEHDMKENHLVLTLDRLFCVDGIPSDAINSQSETNISTLQMVYFDQYPFNKKWLGVHVSVNGTLFHAHTGHHVTPVLIQVTETQALERN